MILKVSKGFFKGKRFYNTQFKSSAMTVLKSLKRSLDGLIKKVPWPAALLKRDSNTGSTVMVL